MKAITALSYSKQKNSISWLSIFCLYNKKYFDFSRILLSLQEFSKVPRACEPISTDLYVRSEGRLRVVEFSRSLSWCTAMYWTRRRMCNSITSITGISTWTAYFRFAVIFDHFFFLEWLMISRNGDVWRTRADMKA